MNKKKNKWSDRYKFSIDRLIDRAEASTTLTTTIIKIKKHCDCRDKKLSDTHTLNEYF